MQLILLCGLSGAGKSTALRSLEDIGYYCIDHLPAAVLMSTLRALADTGREKVAVGVELADEKFLRQAADRWDVLAAYSPKIFILNASNEVLLRRYRETRRPHPAALRGFSIESAIAWERNLLNNLPRGSHVLDTSNMSCLQLMQAIQQLAEPLRHQGLRIHLQSFGFKYGTPADADIMFDARCLPNPYYFENLRDLSGKDEAVISYFQSQAVASSFCEQLLAFLNATRSLYASDNRQCLHVAVGCTGGQHRSVYVVEHIASQLTRGGDVIVRHREERHWSNL